MYFQTTYPIHTTGRGTVAITEQVVAVMRESGIHSGLLNLFVQHTSCSLVITENADPAVRQDLEGLMARLVPDGDPAWHHDTEGPDDMAAHARSVLTHTSLTIPFRNGRLLLGSWQGLYLWEHRTAPQTRQLVISVLG
ncbi:MAG: secondary thiamine-phosphate synthase enzyme YjbQ [Rhodocyclaceae bacterium]|jgi:secondary thiamine-phosphate synthase enzyme|nr:secondary thiamine-phosphate synthase enzyme YjbQ [Rhodocyclaceae bacterium]